MSKTTKKAEPTGSTNTESITSNTKPAPTLEQLREQQEAFKQRYRKPYKVTDQEREYWDKINAEGHDTTQTADEVVARITHRLHRDGKQVKPSGHNEGTAKYIVWQSFKRQVANPVLDGNSKKVLRDLTRYFFGLPGDLDLKKGLFVFGDVGRGKSFLLRLFQSVVHSIQYDEKRFNMCSVKDVLMKVEQEKSIDCLEKYLRGSWCFDDLGFEDRGYKLYGNEMPIMEMLISQRYDTFCRSGMLTHITSNLPPQALAEEYGERIASRAREMFNFVMLLGDDKRNENFKIIQ